MTEMIPHGYAKDEKDVAKISVNAGVDMEMFSGTYVKFLKELVTDYRIHHLITPTCPSHWIKCQHLVLL